MRGGASPRGVRTLGGERLSEGGAQRGQRRLRTQTSQPGKSCGAISDHLASEGRGGIRTSRTLGTAWRQPQAQCLRACLKAEETWGGPLYGFYGSR